MCCLTIHSTRPPGRACYQSKTRAGGGLIHVLGVMKIISFVLLLFASAASAGQCLTYQGQVTIRGTLSKHTFPEQPNYESIAAGDHAATYFFVEPHPPICVAPGNLADGDLGERRVKRVQLVFSENSSNGSYETLRPYLGQNVVCGGSLYHAISGHHHSPVLLWRAKCHAA